MTVIQIGFNMTATADIIFNRKAGFKANAVSMKAIAVAIGGGDYETVINQAATISSWARKYQIISPNVAVRVISRNRPK